MKGVIVAAGYGTRFLPVTKTTPKELLPLYDRPLIDFILDEFQEAGIHDVIVITSRRKKVLDDYLEREIELEDALKKSGKDEMYEKIRPRDMNFSLIRQPEMKGTGHALLLTRSFIGDEPFVVAYPDDIVLSTPGISREMVDLYEQTGQNILAVREEYENISRYGVIDPEEKDELIRVREIIEKPPEYKAPSNFVSIGRYLFTPELMEKLEKNYENHNEGEFFHIDSINDLAREDKVIAFNVNKIPHSVMLDTGEPDSYIRSLLIYLSSHKKGRKVLENFFQNDWHPPKYHGSK